ncbi:unnamed protein product [Brassica rapa subsp. trilocularis]
MLREAIRFKFIVEFTATAEPSPEESFRFCKYESHVICQNTNNHRRVREAQANTQDCIESQRDNIVWSRIETAEQTEKRVTILWLGYLERKRREAQEIVNMHVRNEVVVGI